MPSILHETHESAPAATAEPARSRPLRYSHTSRLWPTHSPHTPPSPRSHSFVAPSRRPASLLHPAAPGIHPTGVSHCLPRSLCLLLPTLLPSSLSSPFAALLVDRESFNTSPSPAGFGSLRNLLLALNHPSANQLQSLNLRRPQAEPQVLLTIRTKSSLLRLDSVALAFYLPRRLVCWNTMSGRRFVDD